MSRLTNVLLLASKGYTKKEINELLKEENQEINIESSNATEPTEELVTEFIEESIKETELENQPYEQVQKEESIDYKKLYEEEQKKVEVLQENARRVNVSSNTKPKDINDILAEMYN